MKGGGRTYEQQFPNEEPRQVYCLSPPHVPSGEILFVADGEGEADEAREEVARVDTRLVDVDTCTEDVEARTEEVDDCATAEENDPLHVPKIGWQPVPQ